MKLICDFSDYTPWGGAEYAYNLIRDNNKLDELENLLEEMGETLTLMQLNDILWFESDEILSLFGIEQE